MPNEISISIFRTGNILILGKCEESELIKVYDYLNGILKEEYDKIYETGFVDKSKIIISKKKVLKKNIEY